jgi:hypothetical protein
MAHPRNITRSAISIACATHVKPAGVESGTKGRTAGEVSMAVLYPIRKACPACGKPMVAVPDDVADGRLRYVCTVCDQDPLHNPTVRNWADSPLKPPEK